MVKYTLAEQKKKCEFTSVIEEGELDNLTLQELRALLPDDNNAMIELINFGNNTGSVLGACIFSAKTNVLANLLELGGKLTVDDFSTILRGRNLNLESRRALFNIAIAHIYERAKAIKSLDDDLLQHIYEVEYYLHYYQDREFCQELIRKPEQPGAEYFPKIFRQKIVDNLYEAKKQYDRQGLGVDFTEAFKQRLISYSPMSRKKLSDEATNGWEELLSNLQEEVIVPKIGLRQRNVGGKKPTEEEIVTTARISDESDEGKEDHAQDTDRLLGGNNADQNWWRDLVSWVSGTSDTNKGNGVERK